MPSDPPESAAYVIDRRAGLTPADFDREYASRLRPVILTDATAHWPARRLWSFEYFEREHGDKRVRFEGREWRVDELIARLRKGPENGRSPYLNMVKLVDQFPEIVDHVAGLPVAPHNRLKHRLLPWMMRLSGGDAALFIGTEGSGFRLLHWDSTKLHVFISQVVGAKDFIVFRPEDTPHVYPKDDVYNSNQSLFPDPFDVDLERFPAFRQARPIRFRLEAGETLFLPAGWWHATSIPEPNIAIAESYLDAYNWRERMAWYQERYRMPQLNGFVKRHVLRHLLAAYMRVADVLMKRGERGVRVRG